jgi:hypothetical protein
MNNVEKTCVEAGASAVQCVVRAPLPAPTPSRSCLWTVDLWGASMVRASVPLPSSVASNPRFVTQLAEARRLHAAAGARSTRGEVLELTGDGWESEIALLRTALTEALWLSCPLERLHGAIAGFSPRREAHKQNMAAKTRLLQPLAQPERVASFLRAYDDMICRAVAPLVGTERVHYATMPTLRVQTPSLDVATIRPHFDGMYDLQDGTTNFWLPLTTTSDETALWLEQPAATPSPAEAAQQSTAGFTYRPLTRPTRFDGRNVIHFTVPNRSTRTRVSLDFRVVDDGIFDRSSRLGQLGYFSVACQRGGLTSPFEKTESGRISKLHGLPHNAEPVLRS